MNYERPAELQRTLRRTLWLNWRGFKAALSGLNQAARRIGTAGLLARKLEVVPRCLRISDCQA
jgi:hypothetical protein